MNNIGQLAHDWFSRPVPDNVEIGAGSWLYSSFAFLHYRSRSECGVRVGKHTGIYNGTFFDLDIDGQVKIGDYCTLVGAIISTNGRVSTDLPIQLRGKSSKRHLDGDVNGGGGKLRLESTNGGIEINGEG